MSSQDQEELIEPIVFLSIDDIEKIRQALDSIAAQVDDQNPGKSDILLSVDFEKVKQRIDNITAQLEEVQRKFRA